MHRDTVPAHLVRLVRNSALRLGIAPQEIALATGLEPGALTDDLARVPTAAINRIWELIFVQGGEGVGLLVAGNVPLGSLHAWDYLVTSAPTLAEGLREGARWISALTDPAVSLDVVEDGRHLTLNYNGLPYRDGIDREISVFALATFLQRMREAGGGAAGPVRVAFAHPAPPRHGGLVDAFGTARIDFDQPTNSIVLLDAGQETPSADPELARIMRRYVETGLASARPVADWRTTFRAALADALADDVLSLERVACRLAVSPRTLQRRLGDHGTTWREEIDAVRHERAAYLLRDTRLPVQSIAARLGYADPRALRRAFQRWTGHTPDAYRKSAALPATSGDGG
ncbi:AraC family transcriptional regulator ligand-binding domain-containing protein [Streptomyces sp. SP17BM10]|uniref:AraC family transcriptional regulator ligand-binding domain-containing protein n=1 Tax=Streptomyces sp. SP17BM10 TaxID=3002530 RepID=UPI002E75D5E4|nr:AraC family transcriptional regulator ligand-binding domain-containing protein [Streptomyces sp. SP17BM10]MEE1783531.1 AraC family transcriptional regulator ligand-binding domain-containing protein [Streptomyces sp. SP17BM10]